MLINRDYMDWGDLHQKSFSWSIPGWLGRLKTPTVQSYFLPPNPTSPVFPLYLRMSGLEKTEQHKIGKLCSFWKSCRKKYRLVVNFVQTFLLKYFPAADDDGILAEQLWLKGRELSNVGHYWRATKMQAKFFVFVSAFVFAFVFVKSFLHFSEQMGECWPLLKRNPNASKILNRRPLDPFGPPPSSSPSSSVDNSIFTIIFKKYALSQTIRLCHCHCLCICLCLHYVVNVVHYWRGERVALSQTICTKAFSPWH